MAQDFPNVFDTFLTIQRNYFDFWARAWNVPGRELGPYQSSGQSYAQTGEKDQQVIPVGEETLDVSTRRVYGAATRVRRVVRTKPVERRVDLQDETIIVERRAPISEAADDALAEREFVMNESREVPVVNKHNRVREVVVLRKERYHRMEVIRDIVRQADVEIEQPNRTMVVVAEDQSQPTEQRRESEQRRDKDDKQQQATA